MAQIIQTTFQFKRGDAARWNELNPTLEAGEPGFELDTNKFKIGNGINTWKELPYKGEGNVVNAQTRNGFPAYGNKNTIYKAQDEKLLYQWNPNVSGYEVLGTFGETDNENLITVDTELSTSSMNPVANKVITMALQDFVEDHYTKQEVDTAIENTNKRIDLLEGPTHFRGIYPNLNDENLNTDLYEFSAGDIFIVGNAEYICTTSGNLDLLEKANYEKLGDVTAEVERISALEEKVGNEGNGEMEATGLYQAIASLENNKLDKIALNNYYSKDETYNIVLVDYIKQTELNSAINTALQTAKESGEFNGADGNGIVSIEEIASSPDDITYLIRFSDGTTFEYDVPSGQNGENGGHYTPSVKDNGNGTMTVSFVASKTGMPAVNPITITLPVPADGENGGYYIPTVETVTENSFKISFAASKSGMPVVEDVTITLPTVKDEASGVGIESIVQTTTSTTDGGENIITVTLTNGNTSTFKVKNGSKGSTGKTAFQYAQDAGYTGSETEFASKLANDEIYFGSDEVMPDDCNLQIFSDGIEESAGTDSFITAESTGGTVTEWIPNYDNLADPSSTDWKNGYRTDANGDVIEDTTFNCFISNYIRINTNEVLRIRGVVGNGNAHFRAQAYNASKVKVGTGFFFEKTIVQATAGGCKDCTTITTDEKNGMKVYEWTAFQRGGDGTGNGSGEQHPYGEEMVYVRITGGYVTTAEDVVITVNAPITYTENTVEEISYTLDKKVKVPQAIENAEKIASMQSGAVCYVLGDSIPQGYYSTDDPSVVNGEERDYTSYDPNPSVKAWPQHMADVCGFTLVNHAIGGTGYVHGESNFRAVAKNINFSECDIAIIHGGVNDFKNTGNTLGTMDNDIETGGTVVSNLRYIIQKISRENPYCKIVVVSPINYRGFGTYETNFSIGYSNDKGHASFDNLGTMCDALKEACEYHGVQFIDATHCSMVNRENIKAILPDYAHPTPEGHRVLGYELARRIMFA